MRPVIIAGIVSAVLCAAVSCMAIEPNQPSQLTGSIVEGNNKFALELYALLRNQEGNLFLSPYSISTALAMTCAGARGQTEQEMAKALQFPTGISNEQFNKAFGEIIRRLNAEGQKGAFELVVANALWGQKDYKFLPDFLTTVKTNYEGSLEQVDFKTQTEEARKTINAWVENKTKDKIKELIKPGMLDTMTRLVLTNAIYFKGKWASQFKPDQTQQSPFTLLSGQKVTVPMMNQKERFGYTEINDIQLLELPYKTDALSMVVLLPKKLDGVKDLEKQINADNLKNWITGLHKREVQVFFPRFKMTNEFELAQILGEMGMHDAFSAKADFSGMTGNRDLFISAVIHKAYVDVNEEGTEAAAATGVVMKLTSVEAPPPVFRADHPFIFLIRDNHTGSILFIGRVANPALKNN
ncbi:MAG: serpin family protein [Sedimentisphaerales bacterium]